MLKKRLKTLNKAQWIKDITKYEDLINFKRTFNREDDQRAPSPSSDKLKEVLAELGRDRTRDILSCGACGYQSCTKFAVAICNGYANLEMCPTYSYDKMNTYIDELAQMNKKLSDTKEALIKSEQRSREEEQLAKELSNTVTAMLQKIPLAIVIVNKDLKILHSNESFIKLLGNDAKDISNIVPGLIGADLKTLVPFHKMFASVIFTGESSITRDDEFKHKVLNVSVIYHKKNMKLLEVLYEIWKIQKFKKMK